MSLRVKLQRYDRIAAGTGIALALLLLPLQLYVSHIYARTIPLVLGGASLVYLFGTKRETAVRPVTLPTLATFALPPAVVTGAAGLVLLAHAQGSRTPLFYVCAATLGTLVLAQVMFASEDDLNPGVVLGQIVVLAGVIRFASLITTPGYVGIDVWVHVPEFTQGMLDANSIGGMGQTKYVMAPLFHLLVGTTAMFTGATLRTATLVSMGLAMPIATVCVYFLARELVPNRWALFAVTLYAISDSVIRWGIHLIPTSLGLSFFLAVLYLIVRILRRPTALGDTVLLLFFFVAQAFTHQVSSFITLVLLAAGWITRLGIGTGFFDRQLSRNSDLDVDASQPIPFGGYFVFNLGLLTLIWSLTPYYGRPFLKTAFLFFVNSIGGNLGDVSGGGSAHAAGAAGSPTLAQFVVLNFDTVGFLLLLFGTVVGSLYALRRGRTNQAVLTLVVASVLMMAFTLLPPLIGVGTFLSGRWFAFLYAGMAVLTAIGFDYLRRSLTPTTFMVVLVVFLFVFPMVMIASPKATVDAPVIEHERPRYSFTEEELAARQTLLATTDSNGSDPIYTDHPYTSLLNPHGDSKFGIATVPPNRSVTHDAVIYRRYQTTGAPYFRTGNGGQRIYRVRESVLCGNRDDVVYTNGDVEMCRPA